MIALCCVNHTNHVTNTLRGKNVGFNIRAGVKPRLQGLVSLLQVPVFSLASLFETTLSLSCCFVVEQPHFTSFPVTMCSPVGICGCLEGLLRVQNVHNVETGLSETSVYFCQIARRYTAAVIVK